jgi:APA family basic amino acid/polyamine antiporter
MAALPNSLLAITLTSNFGTFILYALSCFLCIVAYHKRPDHNFLIHTLIPGFGLLANLVCMGFYVAGPFFNLGTKMEPLTALGISGLWGLYGAIYFLRSSKTKGKSVLLESKELSAKNRDQQTRPAGWRLQRMPQGKAAVECHPAAF